MAFRTRVWPGARVPVFVLTLIAAVPSLRAASPQTPATPQTTSSAQAQGPIFRSGVDLVLVDATVVDRDGTPMKDLKPEDFTVSINGHPRRVVRADFVSYATGPRDPSKEGAAVVFNPGSEDIAPEAPRGRIFVVAIDDTSFSTTGMQSVVKAAQHFIAGLEPEDLVGVFVYPVGATQVDFLHDHIRVSRQLEGIVGLKQPVQAMSEFGLSTSEIVDINAGDSSAFNQVVNRECVPGGSAVMIDGRTPITSGNGLVGGGAASSDPSCQERVKREANELSSYLETESASSLGRLRRLIASLGTLPYRKTVVVISGGLAASDRVAGRPDVRNQTQAMGKVAAAAGVNFYVVQVDTSMEMVPMTRSKNPGLQMTNSMRENFVLGNGLDQLAGDTGAARFNINAGTGDAIFQRVLKETASYYLLGIAPEDTDRDGQFHFVRVNVNAPHATVRARTEVVVPRKITN